MIWTQVFELMAHSSSSRGTWVGLESGCDSRSKRKPAHGSEASAPKTNPQHPSGSPGPTSLILNLSLTKLPPCGGINHVVPATTELKSHLWTGAQGSAQPQGLEIEHLRERKTAAESSGAGVWASETGTFSEYPCPTDFLCPCSRAGPGGGVLLGRGEAAPATVGPPWPPVTAKVLRRTPSLPSHCHSLTTRLHLTHLSRPSKISLAPPGCACPPERRACHCFSQEGHR